MYELSVNRLVKASDGSPITNLAMASGVVVYSKPIRVDENVGFFTLVVTENKSGGAGDCDIYAEYSLDGENFYRPNTTSGGTLTQEPNIVTTLQNSPEWIVFAARLAKYIRIAFDPDADSQLTADLCFQKNRERAGTI